MSGNPGYKLQIGWIQKHFPLTGYEHYHQEIQTYPVNREPLNVHPTTTNDNSALLDLPNVQTGLPETIDSTSSKILQRQLKKKKE